ncbi:MAG: hypothetical protein FWC17_02850, partial [Treponema sp.]|nr:hypothetical protein [Treponema sp.]
AVESWRLNLDRRKLLNLLCDELVKRYLYCKDQIDENDEVKIETEGLDHNDIETILKILNTVCQPKNNFTIPAFDSSSHDPHSIHPSITLETGSLRIISSAEKSVDYFLHEKREELIEALAGGDFSESR